MVRVSIFLMFVLVVAPSQAYPQSLPDGPGKDVTVRICSDCHTLDSISSKRQSRDDWEALVYQMVAFGASGTKEELTIVIDYLTRNFGLGPSKYQQKTR